MSFIQWIHSFFQTQRPTSSHLHLVNQSQALRDMQTYSPVEQIGARTFGEEEMEVTFQKMLTHVGGRDNILLVGEAGHGPTNDGGSSGLLQELALALFESSTKTPPWEKTEGDGGNTESGCLKSHTDSRSRVLQFPVILTIFRDTLIMEPANSNFIREVLRDVQLRADGHTKAMVGIIYSRDQQGEDMSVESHNRLGHIMGQVFKGHPWGVCSYCQSRPQTILEVKRTILETVEMETKGQSKQDIRDPEGDLQRHFKDLVSHLGGKERFLLVGNICPSARPSKRAMVFKEVSRALFEEDAELPVKSCSNDEEIVTSEKENRPSGDCTKLPKPKPFPYSLILMVFRHSFLLEDIKLKQVKEILADVKSRLKSSGALVVGVVCSAQGLEEEEYLRCKTLLHKALHHNFGGKIGVCQYVRVKPESLEEVKRSICNVIRET